MLSVTFVTFAVMKINNCVKRFVGGRSPGYILVPNHTMQRIANVLGVECTDADLVWNLNDDESLFPDENESEADFIYRKHFLTWDPEESFEQQLFLRGLRRPQIAVLIKMLDNSVVFDVHLQHYLETAKVPYADWRKTFQTANKKAPKHCLRRAYWSFLTMLPHAYSEEVSVVGLNNKTDIAKYFEAKAGFHIQRCHRELLSAKVWTFGLQSGLRLVEGKLREAEGFGFDDVALACRTGSFTAQEIAAIVKAVQESLDFSPENIRSIVADILEPDAETVLANNRPIDVKLREEEDCNGEQKALLCSSCGCMYLDTEDVNSGFCCKFGKLCRFRLNPLPAALMVELQSRRGDKTADEDRRFPILVRPLNNYFSFSTLHTTGFDQSIHNAINLNSGRPDSVFRICGRTTTFIPSSIQATLNSYVIDGISSFMPDLLMHEEGLIGNIREMLVRRNPLASTCRIWDVRRAENFDVTIRGCEPGSHPKEIAVLLHRPNCQLEPREFDVRFVSRDQSNDSTRDTHVKVRYDDCRSEALHYPLLHVQGEVGWGAQSRNDPITGVSCSIKEYLRYRFLSADVRECESYEDQIPMTEFANTVSVHSRDETGLPEVIEANLEEPTEFEPWLMTNRDKEHPLIISTSRFHQFGLLAQEYLVDGFSRSVEHDSSFVKAKQQKHGHSQKDYYLSSSFFGSPRFLKEKKNDSLHIVNRKGMPLFFITVTCSKDWPEFRRVLTEGQEASDSPVWTARIFNAKLNILMERLKNGSLFQNCRRGKKFAFGLRGGPGEKGYCIHVVEFQKRGLPHAHICFRPWNAKHYDDLIKDEDYSFVDEIATAQIPKNVQFLRDWGFLDENDEVVPEVLELEGSDKWGVDKYSLLTELILRVENNMKHGNCTDYCHNAKHPDSCRFHFPFAPRRTTGMDFFK